MKTVQPFFDKKNIKGSREVFLGGEQLENLCLERDGLLLLVYYFDERGGKNLVAFFVSIEDAIRFMAADCFGLVELPFNWDQMNAAFDRENPVGAIHELPMT